MRKVDLVHIKSKFNLSFHIWIVNLKKTMHELLQVDVAIAVQIQHSEKSLCYDTR